MDPSPDYKRIQVPTGPPRSLALQHRTPFTLPTQLFPHPVPATPRRTSRSHDDRPPAPRSKPKCKDLRYDDKSSWKAFLHKFVRLSRSQQWTKSKQHDQFCFFLNGAASEYYTLLLEVPVRGLRTSSKSLTSALVSRLRISPTNSISNLQHRTAVSP